MMTQAVLTHWPSLTGMRRKIFKFTEKEDLSSRSDEQEVPDNSGRGPPYYLFIRPILSPLQGAERIKKRH